MLLVNLTLSFFKRKISDFIFLISIVFIFLYSPLTISFWLVLAQWTPCISDHRLTSSVTDGYCSRVAHWYPLIWIQSFVMPERPLPTELHSLSALLLYISIRFTDIILIFIFHKLLNHLTLFSSGFIFVSVSKCLFLSLEKFMEH